MKRKTVDQLQVGMTRSQVRYLLGTPMVPDAFDKDRWDYLYYLQARAPEAPEQRHLIVYFKDDKVASFDRDNVPQSAPPSAPDQGSAESTKFPTRSSRRARGPPLARHALTAALARIALERRGRSRCDRRPRSASLRRRASPKMPTAALSQGTCGAGTARLARARPEAHLRWCRRPAGSPSTGIARSGVAKATTQRLVRAAVHAAERARAARRHPRASRRSARTAARTTAAATRFAKAKRSSELDAAAVRLDRRQPPVALERAERAAAPAACRCAARLERCCGW